MFSKQRVSILISFVLLLSTVLAACSPVSQPAPNRSDATPVSTQEPILENPTAPPAETPTATADPAGSGLQEYTNENFGFRLSLPEGFEVDHSIGNSFVFLAPQGTQGHRERAFLQVEQALDQPAEWFANQAKAENTNFGTSITVSEIEIDGEKAVVLGQMPGQDINRQVFVVHEGVLYHLTFMPDTPQEGEPYHQMVTLYATLLDTLTFLPDRLEVPPVMTVSNLVSQIKRGLEARSEEEISRLIGDDFMLLEWSSPGTSFTRLSHSEAPQVVFNSLLETPEIVPGSMGWPNVEGGPEQFTGYFPNEDVTPVLVQGWGPQGSDEAVIIIARRSDGSLYWRGVLVAQGSFSQ